MRILKNHLWYYRENRPVKADTNCSVVMLDAEEDKTAVEQLLEDYTLVVTPTVVHDGFGSYDRRTGLVVSERNS